MLSNLRAPQHRSFIVHQETFFREHVPYFFTSSIIGKYLYSIRYLVSKYLVTFGIHDLIDFLNSFKRTGTANIIWRKL